MSSIDPVAARPFKNTLLRSLTPEERIRIEPDLEYVRMSQRLLLQEIGEPVEFVYFVESGMASIVIPMDSGAEIEVGTVGYEGIVNGHGLLATSLPTTRTFGQVEGDVWRMRARRMRHHVATTPVLLSATVRHSHFLFALAAQSAACNVQHELSERLARWMLLVSDQTGSNDFALTQEFIAEMLGVRRPTVSVAAMALQLEGLISYRRGRIWIVDRIGLKAAACECYNALRSQLLIAQNPLVDNET